MAAIEDRPALPVADPAPLGLAAFAFTTFLLSAHNAGWAPDIVWVGAALFYGGIAQLLAGMWEFRNRNVFGATAFSTYGAFWLSLGTFVLLLQVPALSKSVGNVDKALGWYILGFAIFNTYMMFWSARVNEAVFGVFLTLEITEILLCIGFFVLTSGGGDGFVKAGGWFGLLTAAVAWYASAAGVVNSMSPSPVLPVGRPLWGGQAEESTRRQRPLEA